MYSWADMIQLLKQWIEEDIESIPSLSEIAGRLGYSLYYVSKKFHQIEGISLREYIAIRKMWQAAAKLYMTQEKIIDIAIRYGYSSQEAFARAFVKVFGIAPTVYRRLQKPTSSAEKAAPLGLCGTLAPMKKDGGADMKLYVKQMHDWNCYAYFAEDVDEDYFSYFRQGLWWQMGNSFIKPYDNVRDFNFCAENFTKYGEIAIKQQLKMIPTPWQCALDLFIPQIDGLGVDWYIHGSVAMALWGIDAAPRDINVIVPNYSDFDKVREQFYKLAITPIERCDNWLMSGGGGIFLEANIGIWLHNKELEPFDMGKLAKVSYKSKEIHVSTLEMLKTDNENYGRTDRLALIEKRIKQNAMA